MKKIFPNIETAIIFVFLICIVLWGVSRCRKKTSEVAIQNAPTEAIGIDTTSPAARAQRAQTATAAPVASNQPAATAANNSVPPQYQGPPPVTPGSAVPVTPASTTPAAQPQQTPSNVPMPTQYVPNGTPPKAPVGQTQPAAGTATAQQPATTTKPADQGTILYVLIDGLNVRAKPELKAKSLGKLKVHDYVYFQNTVTETAQTVRLIDGSEVTKPWFKIKTRRGTIGWVHGSGVDFYKRKPNDGL